MKTTLDMKLVGTIEDYDFYMGYDAENHKLVYNLVNHGSQRPSGGYYDKYYIFSIKGIPVPTV